MLLLSNTGIVPADSVTEILASLLRLTTLRKKGIKEQHQIAKTIHGILPLLVGYSLY